MLDRDVWKRVGLTGLLVGVTAIWGWSFPVMHNAVAAYPVMLFLGIRFSIATAVMAPVSLRRMKARTLWTGLAIGAVLAGSYLLQTLGLKCTTSTNCGFITGLTVLFVPIFSRILYGVRTRWLLWVAVLASAVGMALLAGDSPSGLQMGNFLTALAAVGYGLHVALLWRYSAGHDSAALTMAQMLAVALAMGAGGAVLEPLAWPSAKVCGALVATGVLASAVAFFIQTYVQAHLSAVRTGIILTMEPLFAAAFGYVIDGDRLTHVQIAGAAVMIAAMLTAQLLPGTGPQPKREPNAPA